MASAEPEFVPPLDLDSRFTLNQGGDMSSLVSRGIYELIAPTADTDTEMWLEIYMKFNKEITTQRELHGNVIVKGWLEEEDDEVKMGWLFSAEPETGNFDGLGVISVDDLMESTDFWTTKRPFAQGWEDPKDLERDASNENSWQIMAEKSERSCVRESLAVNARFYCTVKAHFWRKFDTKDANDHMLEYGKQMGYEVIGYYQIGDDQRYSAGNYIIMGAETGLYMSMLAVVATYMALTF